MPSLDFILSRNGATVDITILNRNGADVRVFRAEQYNNNFDLIDTVDSDTFQDAGLDPAKTYKYYLTREELERSIVILEDNTDEEPPWFLAEPIAPSTFTGSTSSFDPSWGPEVTYDTILVDNLRHGKRTRGQFTK